ncbi:MAG: AAA family ATPase [Candidatus Nanopelagicaceae bacterium]
MKIQSVTIQMFRNFVQPQTIEIEEDVTCFVGKNESGKTTVLKALHRLNPANGDAKDFDLVTEYPRWRLSKDRRDDSDLENLCPIEARFVLSDQDLESLGSVLPSPPPQTTIVHATRSYGNKLHIWLTAPLIDIITAAANESSVDETDLSDLVKTQSVDEAITMSKTTQKQLKDSGETARAKALNSFLGAVVKYQFLLDPNGLEPKQISAIESILPKFFYFSNYSMLPGEADLTALDEKLTRRESLEPEDQTVLSLLAHAGVKPSDFLDSDYDSRKAELQAASVDLSQQVFRYWKANTDLRVSFDTDNVAVATDSNGRPIHHRLLKIEVRDARHGDVETKFATRSTGFQWFFSFFAAFSEYQDSAKQIVVLLDEPGTSLHGEAQKDFVEYIFNELGAAKQTLYTTHSQFMVDPTVYEKLRAVHDRATRENHDEGVEVTRVNLAADRDTILPVESALGYTISQHLFLGTGQHLLVEGSSDLIYLMRFSEYFERQGNPGLSPKLSMIPVGGITNMPAFVALMGRRLEVSVLVDGVKASAVLDRVRSAAKDIGMSENRIVTCAQVNNTLPKTADIEDLLDPADYLRLYNWAFSKNLDTVALGTTSEPIIRRVSKIEGEFDHALPAHALTEHREEFFNSVTEPTLKNFAKLFTALNGTVK